MRTIEVEYKGKKINVELTKDNPLSEKDIKISGALIPALELEGGTIETQTDEKGVVWFKANDVLLCLMYEQSAWRSTLKDHVNEDDVAQRHTIDTIGRKQKVNFINESGLYSLILSSQLPKAKEFKRWVTSEVLPQIARTGKYEPKEQKTKEPTIAGIMGEVMDQILRTFPETDKRLLLCGYIESVEKNTDLDLTPLKKTVPSREDNQPVFNPTIIGKKLNE